VVGDVVVFVWCDYDGDWNDEYLAGEKIDG
jgi:hypothetical protein